MAVGSGKPCCLNLRINLSTLAARSDCLLPSAYCLLLFMEDSLYIAVDLGAGSGRVFLCGVAEGELLLEEVRRFKYPPREEGGHLRWPFADILGEIKAGLREAGARPGAGGGGGGRGRGV